MATFSRKIEIDPVFLTVVEHRLDILGRKATRLGITPPKVVNVEERTYTETCDMTLREKVFKRLLVTVEGEVIKVGSYVHVATLDHMEVGTVPIVNVVPGQEIPERFRTASCGCDHCNTTRYRKNTYIFKDTVTCTYKQVGSSCLKEYFGIDPTSGLNMTATILDMDADSEGWGGYCTPMASVANTLAIAHLLVSKHGYRSKKTEENGLKTTANLCRRFYDKEEETSREDMEAVANMDPEIINNYITWGVDFFSKQNSDYAHNMAALLAQSYVTDRYVGYIVSVIPAYNKAMAEAARAQRSDNDYIGSVKQRVTVDVVVDKVIPSSGMYGVTYINIMSQAETGNAIVWFSSNKILDEGQAVKIVGTVKGHNDRDGKHQTVLTRCKVA